MNISLREKRYASEDEVPVRCGHLWICDGASATIDPRPAIRPHVTETATAMLATAPPEQVRALLEPLGTGAFVIGVAPDGRLGFVALNRRHGALTGVAPGAAAGSSVADALPPDPAARLEEACRRCVAARAPVEYEERADTPDGPRWWHTTLEPLEGPDGRIARILGTAIDRTRQRQVEQHLDVLLRHAPSAIAYIDGRPEPVPPPEAGAPAAEPRAEPPAEPRPAADPTGAALGEALAGRQASSEAEVEQGPAGRRRVHSTFIPDRSGEGERVRGVYVVSTDVTDQRRAESALLDTEAKLSAVFDAADNPIVLLDADGTVVAANSATGRRYGMAPAELVGKAVWDLAAPEEREQIAAALRDAVTVGSQVRYETRTGDRYYEEVGSPVFAGHRTVVRLAGYALDVTERKQAELTLQRRDSILEAVALVASRFLTSPSWRPHADEVLERLGRAAEADRAYIFENARDPDGALIMSQIHGWAAPGTAPLIGNPMLQRLPYGAAGLGRWQTRLAAGEAVLDTLEWLPRDESGHLFPAGVVPAGVRSLAVMPLFAGGDWWGFIGFEDVNADRRWHKTEMDALRAAADTLGAAIQRERIDAALRRSEARYKLAVTAGPVSIFDRDLATGAMFLSPQFKEKLGYRDDEIGDGVEDWERLIHPDDVAAARATVAACADGGVPQCEVELRYRHRSGEVRWFVLRAAAVAHDAEGRPCLLAGTQTEVTERIRAQRALHRRSEALALANDELKSFAYIVSHDLRAPLITIEGFVGELRTAFGEMTAALDPENPAAPGGDAGRVAAVRAVLDGSVGKAMGYIEKAAETMSRQLSTILRLSRLGYRDLRPETIDTGALAGRIVHRFAYQIQQRRATVTVAGLPPVCADPEALELVLGNLLSNAVKYLDPDRPGRIDVWAEPGDGDMTVIRVRDNGRGIAEKDRAKVFEIFRRVGRSGEAGEGVGLTFARAAARRWGGDLWVESEPGRGSTFSFTVPAAREDAAPPPGGACTADGPAG